MANVVCDEQELQGMTDKRPSSTKLRRECFDANKREDDSGRVYMICHICNGPIWPSKGDAWEASHLTAHYFGGDATKPAHYKCHREQTAKTDIPALAKSRRVEARKYGVEGGGGGRRAPGQ